VRALILYWTITGTTLRVAERIADGLQSEGVTCELHDLRNGVFSDVSSYDVIGAGFPVHWYRLPTPVSHAIAALGRLDGRPVFAFSLNGTYRGAGLNRARRQLAQAGGLELGAFASYGETTSIRTRVRVSSSRPGIRPLKTLMLPWSSGVQLRAHIAMCSGAIPRPTPGPWIHPHIRSTRSSV
jgi:hypothetical protein